MPPTAVRILSAILCLLCFNSFSNAQLKANFTADRNAGCSPFSAYFTNTTTGASAKATYIWNFDNGNTASLQNAGAVFIEQKSYTVTLTVKDSNVTSIKTLVITVYKNPVVDFTSFQKGCTASPVIFIANCSADSGTIANYFWDFGDGSTGQNSNASIAHTYLYPQKPTVSLSVMDNHGCTNNKQLNNFIEIFPGVTADFTVDKTYLCFVTDSLNLYNKSTSTDVLNYQWNFGDGISSTLKDPVHSFNKRGNYTVKLTAQSLNGCSDSLVKTSFIDVGNFTSQMTLPDKICKNTEIIFNNTSTPTPDAYAWLIDGTNTVFRDYTGYQKYIFTTAGTHTIKLTNTFGNCTDSVTKIITIKELLQPKGFISNIPAYCFPPVVVAFQDTTIGAVKSQWNFERGYLPLPINATGKAVNYNFTQANNWWATLFVTDSYGCTDSVGKVVAVTQPEVYISTTDGLGQEACLSLTKIFTFSSNVPLTSLSWNFGDGTTDTAASPQHTFLSGNYTVILHYTTAKGCIGSSYYGGISVYSKAHAEFNSLSGNTICGNAFATFLTVGGTYYDYWLVDGLFTSMDNGQFSYQFQDTGKHNVSLISYNGFAYGCRDTASMVINVLPSFPKIYSAKNTCDGNRGLVTFTQTSRYAKKWIWDFGDSTTQLSYSIDVPTLQHTYAKTGSYKVILSTINGACINKDSVTVYVLLKEKPLLTSINTGVCINDALTYTITNLVRSPYDFYWVWAYVNYYQYNDGTKDYSSPDNFENWIYKDVYSNSYSNLDKSKTGVSVIIKEAYFNCYDTTNFIPIKFSGAVPGFSVLTDSVCFAQPIILQDTSTGNNTKIINWQWNFGDGQTVNSTVSNNTVSHKYTTPGSYLISLKLTDTSSCVSATAIKQVIINGPQASFIPSGLKVQLNTNVQFNNTTNNFNCPGTMYNWNFGDGSTAVETSPAHTFTTAGIYKVQLIAQNAATGCSDTTMQLISVNNFNVGFSFISSFVNNNNCPPLLVQFYNSSVNYTGLTWNFGDGSSSINTNSPSHVYTSAGTYIITLDVTGYNGLSANYADSIKIKNNTLSVEANILHTCTTQSVTLNAITQNAANYLWDFGDGTIVQATDTFAVHNYATAGMYTPTLIVKNNDGCPVAVRLTNKIIMDSLQVTLNEIPVNICTPKIIFFNPSVINIAADQALQNLVYHWNFGTGNLADTANSKNASYNYQVPGNYTINLKVESPFGCVKIVKATITARQGLGAVINGPAAICQETTAIFTGTTQLPGQPIWHWVFEDGTSSDLQNPAAKLYNNAGDYLIKLITDNNSCSDTITTTLKVVAKPDIVLSGRAFLLCEGSPLSISVSGADSYQWSPATGLNNTISATIIATPVSNITYSVIATNTFGCTNKDAVVITVAHPFKLVAPTALFVCSGKTVAILISGANTYQWINYQFGLSDNTISNPTATPDSTTIYTVVGTDANKCFMDTANIKIVVQASPTVNAGVSTIILAGASYQLQPVTSNDVQQWVWSPAQYLSCTNCPAPIATPTAPVLYTLTVTNANGCTAFDTVAIKLLCSESRIFIPKAFTPDNNGVNDLFSIKGEGIKIVNHLRIYNRYGGLIFERSNFLIDDKSASWDGRYNGALVSPGAYVYIAEMSCNEHTFIQKGTVSVVY